MLFVRDIDRLQSLTVRDKQVAELQCRGARILQGDDTLNLRMQGVIEIQDHDSRIRDDVHEMSTDHHMTRPFENAAFVPRQRAAQEVIPRIAVRESVDIR